MNMTPWELVFGQTWQLGIIIIICFRVKIAGWLQLEKVNKLLVALIQTVVVT